MNDINGKCVDLYVPRKCTATNKLIHAKDRSSVQINVAHLDDSGKKTGSYFTVGFCGEVRRAGEADSSLNHVLQENNLVGHKLQ